MSVVMVTVGPAASGKTTYARQWCQQNDAILTDSDSVREDLYGDASCQRDPSKVFKVMMDDVLAALGSGKNVCYCATNLNSKRRINFISNVRRYYPDTKFVCVVCSAPPEICIAANRGRERQVSENVIWRHFKQFQCPYYGEGWDSIEVRHTLPYDVEEYHDKLMERVMNFGDQHNPHHSRSLAQHCIEAGLVVNREFGNSNLVTAANVHDIGKIYTQIMDENGVAHYYQHGEIGSALALAAGYDLEIAILICYHMIFFNENGLKTWRARLGSEIFDKLEKLHFADVAAH